MLRRQLGGSRRATTSGGDDLAVDGDDLLDDTEEATEEGAESAEAATQVRQLMEGLLAWVAMDKPEDKELQSLVKSARITMDTRTVSAAFQYPVERLLKKMADGLKPGTGEERPTAKTK